MNVKAVIQFILYVNIALLYIITFYSIFNAPSNSVAEILLILIILPVLGLFFNSNLNNMTSLSIVTLSAVATNPILIFLGVTSRVECIIDFINPSVIEMLNTELEKSSYRDESVILRKLPTLGSDEYIIDNYKSVRDTDKPNAYKVSINYTEKKKYLGIIRIHTTCHLYIDYDTGRVSSSLR